MVDTYGITLKPIWIFGWWSSRLICIKPIFPIFLENTFFNSRQVWHENHKSHLPLFTHQVLLLKLEWWNPPLTSLISCSKLSVTGDTAKYLVLHSAEVVHVHHCTHSTQGILYTPFVIRKGENETRSFRSIFPPTLAWPVPPNIPLHLLVKPERVHAT